MFVKHESRQYSSKKLSKEKMEDLKSKRKGIKIMQVKSKNQNNKHKSKDLEY